MRVSDHSVLMFFTAGFCLVSLVLFSASRQALDPDQNKNWWSTSFVSPSDSSPDFSIANHTPTTDFSYSLVSGDTETTPISVRIPSGATQTLVLATPDNLSSPFRIVIHHSDETREIVKN